MQKLRIVLFKGNRLSGGRFPVKIYYYNGKPNYVGCGVGVTPDQWKKDGDFGQVANHPNADYLNDLIDSKFNEVQRALKDGPLPKGISLSEASKTIDFYGLAEIIANECESQKRFPQAACYRAMAVSFKKSEGPMELEQLSITILESYKGYLTGLGRKKNTVRNYLGLAMAVVSAAVKRRLISKSANQVADYTLGGTVKGFKTKLTHEEFDKIKALELPLNGMFVARAAFLIEYYLQGRRAGEVISLRKTDIVDGSAQITIKKNDGITLVPIPEQLKDTIEQLLLIPGPFLLPYLNGYEAKDAKVIHGRIRDSRGRINEYLKKIAKLCDIDKHITTHVGRHTFSKHYYDETKDMRGLQSKLVHGRIATTEVYMEDMKEVTLDTGTKAVFDR